MKQIRKGTFETNSSSTHSICITKEDDIELSIPEEIEIELKNYNYEFGWSYTMWETTEEKLAYLIIGIIDRGYRMTSFMESCAQLEKLLKMLKNIGVKKVEISGLKMYLYEEDIYLDHEDSYVDHAGELGELIETVLTDEKMLKNFLFSTNSYILGGNDNEDDYQGISAKYPHLELFKGN